MNKYAKNHKYFATAKDILRSIDEFFDATLPYIERALTSMINDNVQIFNFI